MSQAGLIGRPRDPEHWFRLDREALQANKPVEYDPAKRLPQGAYKLVNAGGSFKPTVDDDTNGIRMATTDTILMVLLDDPGIQSYEFSAEVSQRLANPNSQVGIFTCLHTIQSIEAPRLNYIGLTACLDTPEGNSGKYALNYNSMFPGDPRRANSKTVISSVPLRQSRFRLTRGRTGRVGEADRPGESRQSRLGVSGREEIHASNSSAA